ncbi:CutC family protein [Coniochaeta sp. 2T2.1]|nr:CutC family protein [Coniochaeta sp. 2T2.1]
MDSSNTANDTIEPLHGNPIQPQDEPSQKPFLEIPLFSRSSLLPAIAAGARRIELNASSSYGVGGTTPDLEFVRNVSSDLDSLDVSVPLRVMLRPRGGGFVYSAGERSQIQTSIAEIKGLLNLERGDGLVFGALNPRADGSGWAIDTGLCTSVVIWAQPFPVVFHRAFDEAIGSDGGAEVESMFDIIQRLGFNGLLTSGGVGNARENLTVVKRIVERSRVGKMEVVVGGGVRGANVGDIYRELREVQGTRVVYHSSCLSDPGQSEEVDVQEVRRIVGVWQADEADRGSNAPTR